MNYYDRVTARNGAYSRTTANEASMGGGKIDEDGRGAFYTELGHCKSLRELFVFPEGEKVTVLEPSIGDASSVIACTGADVNENIRILGVELNDNVAAKTAKLPQIEKLLNADFTCGIRAQHNIASFCFGNPPYLDDEDEKGGRMERTFLEKVTGYLKKGAVLVWVIPYKEMAAPTTVRYMMQNYETIGCWRFRDEEYAKWHQIVYVGRKKDKTSFPLKEEADAEIKKYSDVSKLPVLPDTFKGTDMYQSVEVFPSDPANIVGFTAKELDMDACYEFLSKNPMPDKFKKIINRRMTIPKFNASDIGRPPIPAKKDTKYLVTTAGVGQGLAGTKGVDLHLQRGSADVVEDKTYEASADGKSEICKVTTRTQVTLVTIETNGTITTLQ